MNARLGRANFLLFSQLSTKSGEKMSSYRIARNAQAVKINWGRPHRGSASRSEPQRSAGKPHAWGERQWLRSRFTPRATSLRNPWVILGEAIALLVPEASHWQSCLDG